jgi:hypothetical protein
MLVGLFTPIQGVHLQKEAVVVGGSLILIMFILRLHVDLDQLKNEATPLWCHEDSPNQDIIFYRHGLCPWQE